MSDAVRQMVARKCATGPKYKRAFPSKPLIDAMIRDGELEKVNAGHQFKGDQTPDGVFGYNTAANMVALTEHGAAKYSVKKWKRTPVSRLTRVAQFAEMLAQGKSRKEAQEIIGVTVGTANQYWGRIRRELGWQAQQETEHGETDHML